jgi:hypothetical protein
MFGDRIINFYPFNCNKLKIIAISDNVIFTQNMELGDERRCYITFYITDDKFILNNLSIFETLFDGTVDKEEGISNENFAVFSCIRTPKFDELRNNYIKFCINEMKNKINKLLDDAKSLEKIMSLCENCLIKENKVICSLNNQNCKLFNNINKED